MSKKIVFLDIDGVISPTFEGEFMREKEEYEKSKPAYDRDSYSEKARAYAKKTGQRSINPYDLYTIETRWDKTSIQKLKQLLEKTDSTYVLESSWINSYGTSEWMKSIMQLAGMEDRYEGIATGNRKDDAINEYLAKHPEVERFIIIDDDDYWDFSENYGMNFIRPHHLINDQDCLVVADALNNDYIISHDERTIRITNAGQAEEAWISAEYEEVVAKKDKFLVFDNVTAEYANDEKRIILVRHLIGETRRLAAQENYQQNIIIALPQTLSKDLILHHLFFMWNKGLKLPNDRIISDRNCAVVWSRNGGMFTIREWARNYSLSKGQEWYDSYWRF